MPDPNPDKKEIIRRKLFNGDWERIDPRDALTDERKAVQMINNARATGKQQVIWRNVNTINHSVPVMTHIVTRGRMYMSVYLYEILENGERMLADLFVVRERDTAETLIHTAMLHYEEWQRRSARRSVFKDPNDPGTVMGSNEEMNELVHELRQTVKEASQHTLLSANTRNALLSALHYAERCKGRTTPVWLPDIFMVRYDLERALAQHLFEEVLSKEACYT